jgi:4'-phosphopantetheinyl transferase EntD
VLEEVEALALQGIQAQARVWDSGLGPVLESSPLALEAAFQATGLHRMILTGIMALPAGIEAMVQLRAVPEGAALTVTAWLREGESALYDIDVDDTDGHLLKIRGFKLSDLGPIPADKAFTPPEGGWASAAVATSTQANKLPEAEKKAFSSRGTARRIADRLAGQAAAVQALAPWKAGFPGRAPSGQPILPGYSISISHQKGVGVAVALFGEDVPVGMDMESIEPRAAAWKSEWFSEAEQQLLENPEAESLAWSAKESVLKALGMGMALSPKEVLVEQLNPLQVRLIGEASSILGCRSLVLRRCRFSGHWTEKQEERMLLRVGVFTRLLSRVR